MANTNAPYGFRYVGLVDGSSPNFGMYTGKILSGGTDALYTGDVLSALSSGYYGKLTISGGGQAIGGIAIGFKWVSKSMGKTVYMPYWPGNGDANGDVEVKVVTHPDATFQVQVKTGPLALANVGTNYNCAVGTGNTYNGISGYTLDDTDSGAGASLPFRLYRVQSTDALYVQPGFDTASAYNQVFVKFNNLTQP